MYETTRKITFRENLIDSLEINRGKRKLKDIKCKIFMRNKGQHTRFREEKKIRT